MSADSTITDKAVTAATPPGASSAAFVDDALGRAQANWARVTDPDVPNHDGRMSTAWFIHHTTVVILLENLRRLDPALADRLVPWALGTDSIFSDSYAGELTYEWRQQLTAGVPLSPISPDDSGPAAVPHLARPATTGEEIAAKLADVWPDPFGHWTAEEAEAARAMKRAILSHLPLPGTDDTVTHVVMDASDQPECVDDCPGCEPARQSADRDTETAALREEYAGFFHPAWPDPIHFQYGDNPRANAARWYVEHVAQHPQIKVRRRVLSDWVTVDAASLGGEQA